MGNLRKRIGTLVEKGVFMYQQGKILDKEYALKNRRIKMTDANKTHVECQHCGCSSFSELAIEWTRQDGVKIDRSTGDTDYEFANGVDSDCIEIIGYECLACCTKYELVEGGLIEATDESLPHLAVLKNSHTDWSEY